MELFRIRSINTEGRVAVRDYTFSQMVGLTRDLSKEDAIAFEYDGKEVTVEGGVSLKFVAYA
jgi:hypothetical protein